MLSALALKRRLGVCYDAAWKLKHKLMQAMTCPSGRLVQVDDAYLGGVDLGHPHAVIEASGGGEAAEARAHRWANFVSSNVKRAISGCCRSIKQSKHARRYLDEAAYRFNRLFRLADMLWTPQWLVRINRFV